MTINAAMPAVPQNMSYSGTAAATDNSTAGDFGGALGNMMNAKGTVATEATKAIESEMTMTAQQNVQTDEAVISAEQTVAITQLHKELMMKNAGYAQGELIAMLLNSADSELTQLMSFDGEMPEGEAVMAIDTEGMTEGMATQQILPEMQMVASDSEPVQTENVDFVPEMSEATEMAEAPENPENTSDAVQAYIPEMLVSKAEEEIPAEEGFVIKAEDKTTAEDITDTAADEMPVADMPETTEMQTEDEKKETFKTSAPVTSEAVMPTVQEGTADISAVVQTDVVTAKNTTEAVNTVSAGETGKTVQRTATDKVTVKVTENTADVKDIDTADVKDIDTADIATANTAEAEDIKAVKPEDNTVKSDEAEQIPDTAEETTDFEVTFARAGRKISEKSEEALQLAKSISGTKSDSDLETEQKVTVKQELTDGSVMKNDVQTDIIRNDEVKAERPVKLTVNEAYEVINEKAAATGGKQTFTVELTPETLGKITVKMTSENGKLSVEILTETETAKQLFEARANELANNLRQNDVEIGSYRVETESDQLFNESFDGSSKNPYAERQQKESSEDEDEFERLISEMMGM